MSLKSREKKKSAPGSERAGILFNVVYNKYNPGEMVEKTTEYEYQLDGELDETIQGR